MGRRKNEQGYGKESKNREGRRLIKGGDGASAINIQTTLPRRDVKKRGLEDPVRSRTKKSRGGNIFLRGTKGKNGT